MPILSFQLYSSSPTSVPIALLRGVIASMNALLSPAFFSRDRNGDLWSSVGDDKYGRLLEKCNVVVACLSEHIADRESMTCNKGFLTTPGLWRYIEHCGDYFQVGVFECLKKTSLGVPPRQGGQASSELF